MHAQAAEPSCRLEFSNSPDGCHTSRNDFAANGLQE